jgi:hypothetical protein
MMTLLTTLALTLFQDAPGDRIEITFHSGATIGGTIVAPPPKAEPGSLTLDVTWEYPGLNGTMTVARKEIRSIRKLQLLDEKTKQKLAEMKRRIAEENAREEKPKPSPVVVTPEPPRPELSPERDPKEEELQKAREFYAKYPAPDWSEERRNAIRLKKFRGQVPTPAERDFEAGFELWEKGLKATPPR